MSVVSRLKRFVTASALVLLPALGLMIAAGRTGVSAQNSNSSSQDNNGAQDEAQMIRIGFAVAPVPLNMAGKDKDLVGLGSYLVNVVGDCNGCHSHGPSTEFIPAGNPYLRTPPGGPFKGTVQVNPATYLGGGRDFGPFPFPTSTLHIVSRNLTPDKSGMAEGGHTFEEFIQIMRTGVDMDHAHPNCPTNAPNCMAPPFNGEKLQVMRWPSFSHMTDRQLRAMYLYLSAVPCLEGGPGEPPNRCQ